MGTANRTEKKSRRMAETFDAKRRGEKGITGSYFFGGGHINTRTPTMGEGDFHSRKRLQS